MCESSDRSLPLWCVFNNVAEGGPLSDALDTVES
jgi:hypothetical protein